MPNGGWGNLDPDVAWQQFIAGLHGSLAGYYQVSPELSTGGRQVSIYRPGQEAMASFRMQWDPMTGRFHTSGQPIAPSFREGYRSEGGVGAAVNFAQMIYQGYNPEYISGMETELDPYTYQRRQTEARGAWTGGQALAPWSMQQQTSMFLGTHPGATRPYTSVSWGLEAPEQQGWGQALYSTSGIGRRAFAEPFGPLAYSAEALRTIPGYGVRGEEIRSPFKDVKDRARLDFIGPGVVPTISGGVQAFQRMRGELPGAERRTGLEMLTEFVPGGIFPGAGQAYYQTGAFQGVQMGVTRDITERLSYSQLRGYAQATGLPLGEAGRDLGFAGGTFGQLMGAPITMQYRGAQGVIPTGQGATLRLPYGPGLYSLMEQYVPETLKQLSQLGTIQAGPGSRNEFSSDILRRMPRTPAEIEAYESWLGQAQMLTPQSYGGQTMSYLMGGGLNMEYFQGGPRERPSLYLSGEVQYGMQSGTGLYAPASKMVGLGMQNLTGMGALPQTQLVVGGESAKGMPFLVGGLAQTLRPQQWAPYLGEGWERFFDPQGNLIYGGMEGAPRVESAAQQMLLAMRQNPEVRAEFAQSGLIYRQGWWNFPQGQDTMAALQRADRLGPQWQPGMQPELGMWRQGPGGRTEQFLESLAFKQAVTPFEIYRGGPIQQSMSELLRTYQNAPGQFETLFQGGQAERASWSSMIMASAGRFPQGVTPIQAQGGVVLPTARARELAGAALGSQYGAAVAAGNAPLPMQYMLEAMAETPGLQGRFMELGGGGFLPPPESILATQSFERGEPQSTLGVHIGNVLRALQTGEEIPQTGMEMQRHLQEWVGGSPSVWQRATGGTIPESYMGRATYVGGDPTGQGRTGVVLPESWKSLGLGAEDLAKIVRYPTETGPESSRVLGDIMYAGDYAAAQRRAGVSAIDPTHLQEPGLFGNMFDLADILKVDIDKDLFATIMMRGMVQKLPMYQQMMSDAAVQARGAFPPGDPRHKSMDVASPTNLQLYEWATSKPGSVTTAGMMREARGIDAIMKQRVGLSHNLLHLMNYYAEKSGVDPSTREGMMTALGTLKDEYINLSKGLMGPTAKATFEKGQGFFDPMTMRAFMGQRHEWHRWSAPRFGEQTVAGDIRGASRWGMTTSDVFMGFIGGAFDIMEQEQATYATVGMLGGRVGADMGISGLPAPVQGFIEAIRGGASPAEAEQALAGMTNLPEWFRGTPLGSMLTGRMMAGGLGAAQVTENLLQMGEPVEEWAIGRAQAARGIAAARPELAGAANEYLYAAIASQLGSGQGVIRREGRGGFAKVGGTEEALTRIRRMAGRGGMDVEKVLGMLPLGEIDPYTAAAGGFPAIGTPVPPAPSVEEGIYATTHYGVAGAYAVARSKEQGRMVRDPRVLYTDVPTEWAGHPNLASPSHPSYRMLPPGTEFRRWTGRLGKEAPMGYTRLFRGVGVEVEREADPVIEARLAQVSGAASAMPPQTAAHAEDVLRQQVTAGGIGVPPGGGPPAPPAAAMGDPGRPPRYWGIDADDWQIIGNTIQNYMSGGVTGLQGQGAMMREYLAAGGMQVMGPRQLMEMGRTARTGGPLPLGMAERALNISRQLRANAPHDIGEVDAAIRALTGAGLRGFEGESVRGSAMGAAFAGGMSGLGASNIDMMMANIPSSQIMSIDRAVLAMSELGFQGGFGTLTQKGQLMRAWENLGGRPGTQEVAQQLETAIAGTQWRGVLPKFTSGGQRVARQEFAEAGGFMPDASQGLKKFAENLGKANEQLEKDVALRKAEQKLWEEQKGVEKLTGPAGLRRYIAERGGVITPEVQAEWAKDVGFAQRRVSEAERGLGITQGAIQLGEEQPGLFGTGGAIDRATGGRFRPGRRFMSFFDLMYMRRVGQIFWGGMEAAGQEYGQLQQGMAQGLYGAGLGGVYQSPVMGTAAVQERARMYMGQQFNMAWGPFQRAMAGAEQNLGALPAIAGPAIGAGFLASYFLPGLAAAGPIAAGAAALIGGVGYAQSAATPGARANLAAQQASRIQGGEEATIGQQFQGYMGMLGAAAQQEGGIWNVISKTRREEFQEQYYEEQNRMAGQFANLQKAGYTAELMGRMSPAKQMAAVNERAQNIIARASNRGIELTTAQANQMALQMTMYGRSGLTVAQEDRLTDAIFMGLDPWGSASKAYMAETGLAVTPTTDLGRLALEMTTPSSQAQIDMFYQQGGASMSNVLKAAGVEGLDWSKFPKDWASWMTEPWMGVAGTLQGEVAAGRMSESRMRSELIKEGKGLVLTPSGQQTVGLTQRPVEFTTIQGAQISAAAQRQAAMYQQGLGYVAEGLPGPRDIMSPEYQAQMSRWATGGGVARSQMAMAAGAPWLQTHDAMGFATLQVRPQGFGLGPQDFAAMFARAGVSGTAYAQGFMGQASVSALTGQPIGGQLGAQYAQQEQAYENQRQGIGLQSAMLALQRQYATGQGLPGGRGFWAIEDDMVRLAREQGTYQWVMAGRRMDLQEQQFNETWQANFEQAQTRATWQREDFATQAQKVGMQRTWAREDWAQSAQVREMQWGWQLEDFQEDVRFATGRERRQMIRGQERATTMHNIEGEQIEKEKERQEELWAMQDEQFEKQKARFEEQIGWQEERFEREKLYFEESMKLSREQHEKEMEFMRRRWALEDEQRKLQREYQEKQWALQEAQIGLQYERLEQQKKEQEAARVINELFLTAMATAELAKASSTEAKQAWQRLVIQLTGHGSLDTGHGTLAEQTGFSGMITEPTLMLVGEGRGKTIGAGQPEWVEVKRQGAGGIPEAMGMRGGGGPVSVTVLIDGKEVAAEVMVDRGNNLRVEAYR